MKGYDTAAAKASSVGTNSATHDGHGGLTSETCHSCALSDLDPLLLSPCIDASHATCEVSEDPMLEEVVASFVATSVCTYATSSTVSHPTQLETDLVKGPCWFW